LSEECFRIKLHAREVSPTIDGLGHRPEWIIKAVGEGMCRVCGDDQEALLGIVLGKIKRECCRDGCLSDSTLTAEEEEAEVLIV